MRLFPYERQEPMTVYFESTTLLEVTIHGTFSTRKPKILDFIFSPQDYNLKNENG